MPRRSDGESPRIPTPYNPLEKRRLAESIVRELLISEPEPLGNLKPFIGAGIYAIYFRGDFKLYERLSKRNFSTFLHPIYVGQAASSGGRKGGFSELPNSPALFNRLSQHASSVRQANNLDVVDFSCRYLVVDEFWISLAESLLIESYRPLWNVAVDGFGNHDPGSGRHQGKRPSWDTLHPGRPWASRLQPSALDIAEIESRVVSHLSALPG